MLGTIEKMPIRDGKARDFTFIIGEDGVTYFLHITDWKHSNWKKLSNGKFPVKVEFDSEKNEKGHRAKNAKFVEEL